MKKSCPITKRVYIHNLYDIYISFGFMTIKMMGISGIALKEGQERKKMSCA